VTLQSPTWTLLGNYLSISPGHSNTDTPGVLTRTSLAQATIVIHFPAILSRMPLAEANLVIHFLVILSRMPLAEANLVIHILTILSRMPLVEANLVNMLDFIYIEHDIYCNCTHQKNFKLYKCK
jgi:hypothetical protein